MSADKPADVFAGLHAADPRCLLLQGSGVSGSYSPTGFEIRGSGLHEAADLFAHLHEGHHAALNDTTAWGSALHVTSRVPQLARSYHVLLDQCRRTHKTFATLAPVTILREHHPGLTDQIRANYPEYGRWLDAAAPLAEAGGGPNRHYLLITQYARAAMQTPVLDSLAALLSPDVDQPTLDPPRRRDTPDGRWSLLLRAGPILAEAAAATADQAAQSVPGGTTVLDVDTAPAPGQEEPSRAALDPQHDDIWEAWERAAYAVLADHLRNLDADVLDFDGHQQPTHVVVAETKRHYPGIGLGDALEAGEGRNDSEIAGALLDQGRHVLTAGDRWLATIRGLDHEALDDLVEEPATVKSRPVLVIDVRPPERLTQLYRWRPSTTAAARSTDLETRHAAGAANRDQVRGAAPGPADASGGPLVAVRRVRPSEEGGSQIEHTAIADLPELTTLLNRWRDRWSPARPNGADPENRAGSINEHGTPSPPGHVLELDLAQRPLACVSASTLADTAWTAHWWRPLAEGCDAFILLDVELARVLPGWRQSVKPGGQMRLGRVLINDTSGTRHAVVIQPGDNQPPWVSIHDALGAGLVVQWLSSEPDVDLVTTDEHLASRLGALTALLTHLLATESFVDAAALGRQTE